MPDTRSTPEKLPYPEPEASYQRSINDMFARMLDGMSPSRSIRTRGRADPTGHYWHSIDEVHLARGAPKRNGLFTVGEFLDFWSQYKKMRKVKSIDKAWRKDKKNYGLSPIERDSYPFEVQTLDQARDRYERDRYYAQRALWWKRLPHPNDILFEHREEAANEVWRQQVTELTCFEVNKDGGIRPRPAAIDAENVCRVCCTPIERSARGRPKIYCSPEHRQQRENERNRLFRKVAAIKRRLY